MRKTMKRSYPLIENGEVVELEYRKNRFKIACCDCGLVHIFSFVVKGEKIYFKVERDKRATSQMRRYKMGFLHKGIKNWILKRKGEK